MNQKNLHFDIGVEWLWMFLAFIALLSLLLVLLGYIANKVSAHLERKRNEKRLTEIWRNRTRNKQCNG